ncbi:5-(carboxyamino)imidazole ribonucleotide synthase [Companilactobacillus allii]|uniref:N5-carboxyaminoimidazole ribonucleotide synthase n=1 Tax=Companilactobacillus allii TaxID=1847728 RepID=A0A1P8Q423_9LACO|nr:5-(carboxyamino)imidazole ribonucleotide synthase [Companilactobacillus allii]APX72610.1 5-(carboxyamino)imidazole ribonucleotide synthase [Companilactobacillus allii]USQ69714.1 5-(carboxyamino)imidazole ribonucleotide synthase [Companilactobacillus allii]
MNNQILSGSTIGIIGGGQLGQMMSLSAKEKGYKVIILDPQPNCSAAQVSDEQIIAEYSDLNALIELAKKVDVLTYEFENVDATTIKEVSKYTYIPQGTKALEVTQNRIFEKDFLEKNDFPVVPHEVVSSIEDFTKAIDEIGAPSIIKTIRGGYDGKGQIRISSTNISGIEDLISSGECILEKTIILEKEVSVVVSRNVDGQTSLFPVIENIHRENILHLSICPARISSVMAEKIQFIAEDIANKLELVGTMCVEFFISNTDELFVNEIAPRPHNSGHLTIEACNISQFDAHILGICNLPMPKIKQFSPAIMVNVLGQHLEESRKSVFNHVEWNLHDYGKSEIKHNRKMGHITILTKNLDESINKIEKNSIWDK